MEVENFEIHLSFENASDELKVFQFAKQWTPCSLEHGLQENKQIDIWCEVDS
jgi:hypothetical protein